MYIYMYTNTYIHIYTYTCAYACMRFFCLNGSDFTFVFLWLACCLLGFADFATVPGGVTGIVMQSGRIYCVWSNQQQSAA